MADTPKTHCEKYGHCWRVSHDPRFDLCTYRTGRGVPCGAIRRRPDGGAPAAVPRRPTSTPSPSAEQMTLL
ncbi:MAG: hypothetical protein JO202_02880 [Ktedonobacteraceae bacterium]|nr:hypothetical protein [Ktedonobacteraceae bacterium]